MMLTVIHYSRYISCMCNTFVNIHCGAVLEKIVLVANLKSSTESSFIRNSQIEVHNL